MFFFNQFMTFIHRYDTVAFLCLYFCILFHQSLNVYTCINKMMWYECKWDNSPSKSQCIGKVIGRVCLIFRSLIFTYYINNRLRNAICTVIARFKTWNHFFECLVRKNIKHNKNKFSSKWEKQIFPTLHYFGPCLEVLTVVIYFFCFCVCIFVCFYIVIKIIKQCWLLYPFLFLTFLPIMSIWFFSHIMVNIMELMQLSYKWEV